MERICAARERTHHNPKRERGTQNPAESLAYASGWDSSNKPLRFGFRLDH